MRVNALLLLVLLGMICGCQSHPARTTTTTTTVETSPRTNSNATLDGLVANVQQAKSAQAEADALRALRKYETENSLTYTVRTFNRDTDEPVAGPTVSN